MIEKTQIFQFGIFRFSIYLCIRMDKSIHTRHYRQLIGLVREEREKRQITQGQLAAMLGVQQAAISKIENCERRIDLLELRQICQALGVSLIDIINKFEERISQ